LEDDLLISKLETIWNKATSGEKHILKKVVLGSIDSDDRLTHEYTYLYKIGFIFEENHTIHLKIPLLTKVIDRENQLSQIRLFNQKIYINNKDLTDQFTRLEKILLISLLSQKQLVKRETIATSLWGDNPDKYSDWAIDRLVYRIRKKLISLGVDGRILKTVKKKGLIFG